MGGETEERWQRNVTCIRDGISYLWDTKEFSDAKIVVRGYSFKVHKLILAARSSEFARILLTPNASNEIIVDRISPVTKDGVAVLLHFIYKDVLLTNDKRSVIEGYLAAKYFKQNVMISRCEKEIESWNIVSEEVCALLDIGSDIPVLKDKCISHVQNNGLAVISSGSFKKASFKSVRIILESRALESVPDMERIKYIMAWGAYQESEPVDYSLVRKKFTAVQPYLLGKLGFERLSLSDLPFMVKEYPGLLTPIELTNFMLYHATKNVKDLPEWCSPSV